MFYTTKYVDLNDIENPIKSKTVMSTELSAGGGQLSFYRADLTRNEVYLDDSIFSTFLSSQNIHFTTLPDALVYDTETFDPDEANFQIFGRTTYSNHFS